MILFSSLLIRPEDEADIQAAWERRELVQQSNWEIFALLSGALLVAALVVAFWGKPIRIPAFLVQSWARLQGPLGRLALTIAGIFAISIMAAALVQIKLISLPMARDAATGAGLALLAYMVFGRRNV